MDAKTLIKSPCLVQLPKCINKCAIKRVRTHRREISDRFQIRGAAEQVAISTVDDYNKQMAERMGWIDNPYEYKPERGLYYHHISEDVVVGSQPRNANDISELAKAGIRVIHNLQQDTCLNHWNVNIHELQHAAHQNGLAFIRTPAIDFDPNSLRSVLPHAVAELERARISHGKVYVHCTAGLGRSPAVAIASLYWFGDMQLDEAYDHLTSIRPCGPNKDAIRGATYDLLSGRSWDEFYHLPQEAFATLSDDDRRVIREKLLGNS